MRQVGDSAVKLKLNRRSVLKALGASAFGAAAGTLQRSAAAIAAPTVAKGTVLTVSTWGGITQDGIKAHVAPEFERVTGATIAYDIGGLGARFNKLLAQRASPSVDVFFSTDESVVAGRKAGILSDASQKNIPNYADVADWAKSLKGDGDALPGVPYTLIAYVLGSNPASTNKPVVSWADMWRPEFAGKLAFASPVHSMMPAFVIMAAEMTGGSAEHPDSGFAKLAELRPAKLTVFWTDWAPLDKSGDVTLATEFDYYLEAMKDQKYPIEAIVPKEKGFGAPEYISIVAGTKNKELAEEFLNQMISPQAQQAFAVETYQGAVNTKVKLTDAERARCSCGAKVDELRFFDPHVFAENRAAWTERLNTEVVPKWNTR
jgi:putative spermidine/putrescine transport system substrate-binding protein